MFGGGGRQEKRDCIILHGDKKDLSKVLVV